MSGQKQSVYLPEEMIQEIKKEAARQDRPFSWMMQQAWRLARGEIMRTPSSVNEPAEQNATENAS